MSAGRIEWCDRTWNPVVGCGGSMSLGCMNCWAARQARRIPQYADLLDAEGGWSGKVRLLDERLDQPRQWRKPARVAVSLMGDLGSAGLGEATSVWVAIREASMSRPPGHDYLVLTKRPEALLDVMPSWPPMPNVWVGVSIEDQQTASERVPALFQAPPGVLRWVSVEPLLVPLNLWMWLGPGRVEWVVIGGESGPGAEPCVVEWIADLVRQCREAGTACFVKQLGARPYYRCQRLLLADRRGADPAEWPPGDWPREWPRPHPAEGQS